MEAFLPVNFRKKLCISTPSLKKNFKNIQEMYTGSWQKIKYRFVKHHSKVCLTEALLVTILYHLYNDYCNCLPMSTHF